MKRMIKIMLTLVVVGIFVFMAYGSGNDKKWESNNKELFCGVQFEDSEYLEPIDKEIKKVTIFNIDGTYISYKNWQAVDESSKQEYRDSGVNSSGADNDFNGTWEIVQPTESMKGDYSTQVYSPTYIKFKCNNGTGGYAEIYCSKNNYLHLSIMDINMRRVDEKRGSMDEGEDNIIEKREIAIGMFGGMASWSGESSETVGNKTTYRESGSNIEKPITEASYSAPDAYNKENGIANDNGWERFLVEFKKALIDKNKSKIISMTDKNEFFDGGGGSTINEFLNNADNNTDAGWDSLINSLNSGIDGTNEEKQTIGGYPNLYFRYKDSQWYWNGIVGD